MMAPASHELAFTTAGVPAAAPSAATGAGPQPTRARGRTALWVALVLLASSFFSVALAASDDYAARFDTAWRLVDERYWDVGGLSVDWQLMRQEYEPQALAATSDDAFYRVVEAMYSRIGDNHSVFVPPTKVDEIRLEYGDLPCLGVFGTTEPAGRNGKVEYRMLEGAIGYLRVPDLASDNVAADTGDAVRTLQDADARALILDLRGNPGGRLVTMMQVAGIFTRGFLWRTVTRWTLPVPYPAIGPMLTELPLAVLVDGDVNSAAEGLAGALQRNGRATIVGATTAGNVEAVLPFCLRDGSQAWIATGVLAPIGGPTWEGRGVVPDVPTAAGEALDVAAELLRQR